jgi:hypothetical protein
MKDFNRRDFIKTMGLLSGSLLIAPACTPSSVKQSYRAFKEDEAVCLIALCEQIIPRDEVAGATDAGVIRYIDKQSTLRFPKEQIPFKSGVAS